MAESRRRRRPVQLKVWFYEYTRVCRCAVSLCLLMRQLESKPSSQNWLSYSHKVMFILHFAQGRNRELFQTPKSMMLSQSTRMSLVRVRARVPCSSFSSMWDRVRPSEWHPIATLEQSMMDMDHVASRMISAPWQVAQSMLPRMHKDDGEFFKDLIPSSKKKHKNDNMHYDDDAKLKAEHEAEASAADHGFSSYSYSSSTIVDEGGRRVTSVRRRYEDSAGRLKAVHERDINGTKVKSLWFRTKKDDKGEQKTLCDEGISIEDFDEQWKRTPFGKAEANAGHHELPDGVKAAEKESERCIPGPDYEAAEKAPEKKCGKEAEGVTKESHDKSRKDAIAEGSKTQEEETTPKSGAGYGYGSL